MNAAGTKIGAYEITGALGAGGMGEVYRARDTRLGREVALKVLPASLALDPERLARLHREARLLASLNHPNIAAIYGYEDSGATHALVMELIEGPTLAERIRQGPIATEEALNIGRQIAEALEYAHERGIVHRDLKPANVKLSSDDAVKVLDFGLAKALEADPSSVDLASSPTLTHMATQAGIILGTAPYMAPEQAKGKNVDRRADVWAFGCVLYEMLSGRSAFGGESVTETLAAVVRGEPDWTAIPAATPRSVRDLLQRCLKKDPRQRLQSIGDGRIVLEEAIRGADAPEITGPTIAAPRWRTVLPWAAAGVLAVVAAGFAAGYFSRAPVTAPVLVAQIGAPAGTSFAVDSAGSPVFSPDGERLAYPALGADGKWRLYVQTLNGAPAQPLEGTEGASDPFWSPDGRQLGFFTQTKLYRISASGGLPVAIADVSNSRGGSWGPDGTILYAPSNANVIERVQESGGVPQPVTRFIPGSAETTHRWPQFLPDGKHFLFYAHSTVAQNCATYVASLNTGAARLLLRGESAAKFAPPGSILFVQQGKLMARRFDSGSRSLVGDAVPLAEPAAANLGEWRGIFAASSRGLLVYQAGASMGNDGQLSQFSREGALIRQMGQAHFFTAPSLSPDGRQLAVPVETIGGSGFNIWLYDLERGISSRLTFTPGIDREPSWTADGRFILFSSNRSGNFQLYKKAADGSGKTTLLLADPEAQLHTATVSPDGRTLVFERRTNQPGSRTEIWAMSLSAGQSGPKAHPLIQNPQSDVRSPAISPDGRWIAYESAESGQPEIYVVAFGGGSGKLRISLHGGQNPRWQHDGRELIYSSLDERLIAAEIAESGGTLVISKTVPLFQVNEELSTKYFFDVSADGQEFFVSNQGRRQSTAALTIISNWPMLLPRR